MKGNGRGDRCHKRYKGIPKDQNKKTINIVRKQGELLKQFKKAYELFENLGISLSHIYFKISLLQMLVSSYFKNHFKIIKSLSR